MLNSFIEATQVFYLLYFLGLQIGYFSLNIIAFFSISRYMANSVLDSLPIDYSRYQPPISLLVPAYNEAATIEQSIRSVLQLEYGEFEIIVINDGSKDETLGVLLETFRMQAYPMPEHQVIPTEAIRGIYHSTLHPRLKVIDKENGGKADSLNAGVNYSLYPLVCCLDADSILQRRSLHEAVQPFLGNDTLICCGGTVRVANGSRIKEGHLLEVGLSNNLLALFQTVEYLRAFLFGREGWSPMNALMIVSGAFGIFDRRTLLDIGGYRTQTIGEDMEITVRMHRRMLEKKQPYRIQFIANPVCWTEAPEDLKTLKSQRIRWQRGLLESLNLNRELLFARNGGALSWFAFPFFLVFEAFGPLFEVSGYLFMLIAFLTHLVSLHVFLLFLAVSIGLGMILSVSALLLEEISFHLYPKNKHLWMLLGVAILENFGYRQLNAYWRFVGIIQWVFGHETKWGDMKRKGSEAFASES